MSEERFRDSLANVTSEGKRKWFYPRKPKGKFYNYRTYLSFLLLLILFGTPFLKVNGRPFILLNFLERKFILFGLSFGPQDFHLLGLAMITIVVFIILFTVVFGRIFCGWFCPQTIFMEMVFRKIEYLIEGNSSQQKKLDNSPLTAEKFFKKLTKHIIFYLIAFVVGNTLLAYIIGKDKLFQIISQPPSEHLSGFFAVVFFSLVFYFIFSRFREQACTMVCPYGRLQGVLLDQNSIVISYDYKRGEPRGKAKNKEAENLGDCVDCKACVDVCPTGIDIRNGTQLECVNCTACIDACDGIMTKLKRPTKLIRYASKNSIETGEKKIFTPRVIGYSIVLSILLILNTVFLVNRTDVELKIFRTPGLLFQEQKDGRISNLYDLQVTNKTFEKIPLELKLINMDGEIKMIGNNFTVEPLKPMEGKFFVIIDPSKLNTLLTPLKIAVISKGDTLDVISTSFLNKVRKEKNK